MAIKKGDKVKVDYTGSLDDGSVFDSSEGKKPLEFEVGSGQVIKGFDEAVIGMEAGEEKDIRLEPSDAYGEVREEMKRAVPRDALPKDKELKIGMTLLIGTPDGQRFPVKISKIDEDKVVLDMNHPLAGKALNFKIKVAAVE